MVTPNVRLVVHIAIRALHMLTPCEMRYRQKIIYDGKSKQTGSDKLFGKYDEFVRMFLGFLLTGVVGAYLSHRYTTQQADLSAAAKVFSEHSKLVGQRYFAMNQVTLQLRDIQTKNSQNMRKELDIRWGSYKSVLQEWNSARGFNREMIRLYFGDEHWNRERDIHYQFRSWGKALELEYKTKNSIDFECLNKHIDELLEKTHEFRVGMAQAMQAGNVGSSRKRRNIATTSHPEGICLVSER